MPTARVVFDKCIQDSQDYGSDDRHKLISRRAEPERPRAHSSCSKQGLSLDCCRDIITELDCSRAL